MFSTFYLRFSIFHLQPPTAYYKNDHAEVRIDMKNQAINFSLIFTLLLAALWFPGLVPAQQSTSELEIKVSKVNGQVSLINASGSGGTMNAAVSVGTDGLLLVDGFILPLSERLRSTLKSVSDRPVKFLINTHWHGDHTGPNNALGSETVIIAHANTRRRLMTEQRPPWLQTPMPPRPPQAWPVITFEQSLSLHFNGEEIKLIHLSNAHTDGDTVVWFTGSKVVSMGDVIFLVGGELNPSSDSYSGGDAQSLERGLASLIAQLPPDVTIIPGHGRLLTLNDLKAYHRILTGTIELVRRHMAEGKKFDEIKAQRLPKEFDSLGNWKLSPEAWIETVYESLMKNRTNR